MKSDTWKNIKTKNPEEHCFQNHSSEVRNKMNICVPYDEQIGFSKESLFFIVSNTASDPQIFHW